MVFDSNRLSYEGLLGYFFRMHDPTTLNRQHNDVGTQYRSAIFYTSEEQKKTAESVKAKLEAGEKVQSPDHDRDRGGVEILFRRGVSPKVSGEKSGRLHLPRFAGLKCSS